MTPPRIARCGWEKDSECTSAFPIQRRPHLTSRHNSFAGCATRSSKTFWVIYVTGNQTPSGGSMATSSIRSALDREENRIKEDLLRMGSMVEAAIYRVVDECLTVIATQQPAAHDLRIIVAATHVAVELERMADHAEGIAKITLRMLDQPLLKPLLDMPIMANIVKEMTRQALDSFMRTDVELAQQTIARDDDVDQMYQQIFRELLTYMLEDPKNISRATFLLWVAHNLERIGDRATNLCERTIFVATGRLGDLNVTEPGETGHN